MDAAQIGRAILPLVERDLLEHGNSLVPEPKDVREAFGVLGRGLRVRRYAEPTTRGRELGPE